MIWPNFGLNAINLLLARGRDRLETRHAQMGTSVLACFSYSLGDAIDWKQQYPRRREVVERVSYSLGDAIDWKLDHSDKTVGVSGFLLLARGRDRLETLKFCFSQASFVNLLLARGRDRLETGVSARLRQIHKFSYSLGDAIDWKQPAKKPLIIAIKVSYSLGDAIDWKPIKHKVVGTPCNASPTR